ncbi:MAG: helix-turn-helix transcriptional regulator [Rhizobiales bacterium]|nr:helix-turn-helix transcriptional regulator [Hyphomicrobiales bacterium]
MSLGERLKEQRLRTKLTAGQIAVALGFSDVFIYQLESGVKKPSLDTLIRLARRYKTSTDYLLGLTDDPSPSAGDATGKPALTPQQQQFLQEAIDALSSLPPREQRVALDILRVMRKSEEDTDGPLVPHIIE